METLINDPTNIEKNWNIGKNRKWVTHSDGIGKNWKYSKDILMKGKKVS